MLPYSSTHTPNPHSVVANTTGQNEYLIIPFSYPGALTVSNSPYITSFWGGSIVGWSATLSTAGSSTTTVELLLDGNTVSSMNISSGSTYSYVSDLSETLKAHASRYAVGVTTVGTGAADLAGEIILSVAAGAF